MSVWGIGKRLFGAKAPEAEAVRAPQAVEPAPVMPTATPTISEDDNRRLKYVIKGAEEFGLNAMLGPALKELLLNSSIPLDTRRQQLLAHRDFPKAEQAVVARRRFELLPDDEKMIVQIPHVIEVIQSLEDLFANRPSTRLHHEDKRLGSEPRPLCWQLAYSRIAGTMSDKEQFVFIFGTALETGYLDLQDNIDLIIVAAMGTGADQDWRKRHEFGDAAKHKELWSKYLAPKGIDFGYQCCLEALSQIERDAPEHPLVQWAYKRLRSNTHSWATSR